MSLILLEGGNVFAETQRINQADVLPTVQWLEKITGLSLVDNMLGTTGKKETSGDLDLAVDANTVSKDAVEAKIREWCIANQIPEAQIKGKGAGWLFKTGEAVHFKTPIRGDVNNGFVQTDFMFVSDMEWAKFSLAGSLVPGSPFKGADKHILLSHLAKYSIPNRPLSWSYKNGLIDKETKQTISKDPNQIAQTVLGKGATQEDIISVESILRFIKTHGLEQKFAPGIESFKVDRKFSDQQIQGALKECVSFYEFFLENEKNQEVGFFPGAFKPLHTGHLQTVNQMAEQVAGPFFVLISSSNRVSEGGLVFDQSKTLQLLKLYKGLLKPNVQIIAVKGSPIKPLMDVLAALNANQFEAASPEVLQLKQYIPNAASYTVKLVVGEDPEDVKRYDSVTKNQKYAGRAVRAEILTAPRLGSASEFRAGLDAVNKDILVKYIPLKPGTPQFSEALSLLYSGSPQGEAAKKLFSSAS